MNNRAEPENMYRFFFATFLSRLDPEKAHHLALGAIRVLPYCGLGWVLRHFTRPDRSLAVTTLGKRFESPFGLAAGFDKDGEAVIGLGQLGFGHVEIGTLTSLAQKGNPRPRLFRLIDDRALINRMGFNNRGAARAARLLRHTTTVKQRPVIGINIGKSRAVDIANAVDDYCVSARLLAPIADYLVINVSSPNTPGLRGLQEIGQLAPLLAAVKHAAASTPVLVKIGDLSNEHLDSVVRLALECGLAGIVASNTTVEREGLASSKETIERAGAGGLSGPPLADRALEVLRRIRALVPADFCVISVGGVTTATDVKERLRAGATLVQGYTGFVYVGPMWALRINKGLVE